MNNDPQQNTVQTNQLQRPPRFFALRLFALGFFAFIALIIPVLLPQLWFLVLVSLVPLFFVLERASARSKTCATTTSFLIGVGYFSVVLYPLATMNTWWWTVSSGFFWEHKSLLYLAGVIVLAFICSFFTFGIGSFSIKDKKIFLLPIVWTLGEILRVHFLFGLEWGTFGLPLANNSFFIKTVSLARGIPWLDGIFVLTFVAITANICIFLILKFLTHKKSFEQKTQQKTNKELIFPALCLVLILLLPASVSNSVGNTENKSAPVDTVGMNETLRVAIISPELTTEELATQRGTDHIIDILQNIEPGQNLVILPENIFPTLVIDEKTLLPVSFGINEVNLVNGVNETSSREIFGKISEFSRQNQETSLILGLHTEKSDGVNEIKSRYNSAVVFENGRIVSIYNKIDLLPLTEKSFGQLQALNIEPLKNGQNEPFLTTKQKNAATILPLICSEALVSQKDYPNPTKKDDLEIKKTAQIMVNLSNDNIFDSRRAAEYNKNIVRIRAIEANLPIIRSTKGGFSGAFSRNGKEIPPNKTSEATGGEILYLTLKTNEF